MRLAVPGWLLFTWVAFSAAARGDAPKAAPVGPTALDRSLYDTLRDVHNKGADLYNGGDPVGCYRLFEGALLVARSALRHRPAEQKLIDDGLAGADREPSMSRRAFLLHELIESVRSDIRPEGARAEPRKDEPIPAPKKGPQKMPQGRPYEPLPILPRELPAEPKSKADSPLGSGHGLPPLPRVTAGVGGRVLFQGLAMPRAEVTFVTRGRVEPRVYESVTAPDGVYRMEEVEPGRYTVLLSAARHARPLPGRYEATNTSPLVVDVKPGGDTVDFVLQ